MIDYTRYDFEHKSNSLQTALYINHFNKCPFSAQLTQHNNKRSGGKISHGQNVIQDLIFLKYIEIKH